ncbi:MAG: FKBP-type peptidyl-prolyl cis-trans isomerase [Desulfobacterales bacterium]|nr:FKBP-type peptidyl-prolyl cis-trans isomerase [Desulfobacterales bacterium]
MNQDLNHFDTSQNRQPVELTLGSGDYIQSFEKGIIGMAVGDKKTFIVRPEEAFGVRHMELMADVKKSDLPVNIPHVIGQKLTIKLPEGDPIQAVISTTGEDSVTLDANHPLAGRTLVFDVKLVEIV